MRLPHLAPDGSAWRKCPECGHFTLHAFFDGDVEPAAHCFTCGFYY